MDFALSEEQIMLRDGAARYLTEHYSFDQCRKLLERDGGFGEVESFETLLRNWHVKGLSVRPVHRMVAHSGFIIVSRRLASPSRAASEPLPTVTPSPASDDNGAVAKAPGSCDDSSDSDDDDPL